MSAASPPALASDASVALDAESPWPGLLPYREEHAAFFHGRQDEADELFRRVGSKSFTLLFGQSGLGKTSLLNACLYPRLRQAGFLPIDLRLDFQSAEPLAAQTTRQIAAVLARELPHLPLPAQEETLWIWFHRADVHFARPDGTAALPVLVFDQFEEFFTLGADTESRRERSEIYLAELAGLVENRLPEGLDPSVTRGLLLARQDYRVLVSMREDYVAYVESLAGQMRSVGENRMRLLQMDGVQALAAVNLPGSRLISPAVSRQVVRFIASRRHLPGEEGSAGGDWDDFERLRVEPSLLSLVCRELNRRRQQRGLPQITAELVAGTGALASIVEDFYERCLAGEPSAVRVLVEDRLLTRNGFRDNLSIETAEDFLRERGAEPAAIGRLVDRRLLRFEERLEVRRVELAHDVLTQTVRLSRDQRQREEALAAAAQAEERARVARRRARRVVAAIGTGFVLAVIAAVVGFTEYRHAEAARSEAELQRQRATEALVALRQAKLAVEAGERAAQTAKENAVAARKAADELIRYAQYDLSASLGKIGQLKLLESVNERIRRYHEAHPVDSGHAESQREQGVALSQQGDVLRAQGQLADARRSYEGSLAIFEELATKNPQSPSRQRDLAVSYEKVADVLREEGQWGEALSSYRHSLAIFESQEQQEPENPEWARNLAVCLVRLGDSLREHGQLAEASQSYQKSLTLSERLTRQEPENALWQGDLAVTYERLGDLLSDQEQRPGALKYYRKSLSIRERLAKQEPENAGAKRDLSVGFEKVGNVLRDQGLLAEALKAYRETMAIAERLSLQDPTNAGWQRDLAVCYEKVGDLFSRQQQLAEALGAYRRSLAIREHLAQQDSGNAGWQSDLADSYAEVGDILRAQAQAAGALKSYRESLSIREQLVRQDPENTGWQRALALGHGKMGDLAQADKRWVDAAEAFGNELEIARRLMSLPSVPVGHIADFAYAAGRRWELLRDAPAHASKLEREAVLEDLRAAHTAMTQLQEAGRLAPPMDKSLPWIEGYLRAAAAK